MQRSIWVIVLVIVLGLKTEAFCLLLFGGAAWGVPREDYYLVVFWIIRYSSSSTSISKPQDLFNMKPSQTVALQRDVYDGGFATPSRRAMAVCFSSRKSQTLLGFSNSHQSYTIYNMCIISYSYTITLLCYYFTLF